MSAINYRQLNDAEKLDLLRLLYHDLKNKEKITARDIEQKALIVAETQVVYNRIKRRSN
jgi:H2-forming N5,N10-methylenetetrahydromethanopterin dehydrogenase-like enzyme